MKEIDLISNDKILKVARETESVVKIWRFLRERGEGYCMNKRCVVQRKLTTKQV